MVAAAKKNNRIVQIGAQRVSSALCAKARELYHEGAIGEVENVELTLGRNDPTGAWEYPPPPDLSPQNLDWDTWLNDAPKIPFNPERFARWRCWKEYGTGVGGDLMVHLISGMQVTLGWNEPPRSASALGGILRWKDGRNMPDIHTVLFDYHGIPVYVRLGLGTESPESARYYGPKGILDTGEFEIHHSRQKGVDTAPCYYTSSYPQKMRDEYVKQWHEEHDVTPGQEPISSDTLLSRQRLGRSPPASVQLLPIRAYAQAAGGGRSLRQSRGHRLPHGQRIVLPQESRVLGRSRARHRKLSGAGASACQRDFRGRDGQIRTADLSLRRRPLYPSELRPREWRLPDSKTLQRTVSLA